MGKPKKQVAALGDCFLLVALVAYYSNPKMEAVGLAETTVNYTGGTCHIQILLLLRVIVLSRYCGQKKIREPEDGSSRFIRNGGKLHWRHMSHPNLTAVTCHNVV
jgi:hypothetical protein